MPYTPSTKLTNIMMFNSRNLGALVVKEDPHVMSWIFSKLWPDPRTVLGWKVGRHFTQSPEKSITQSETETPGAPSLPASPPRSESAAAPGPQDTGKEKCQGELR
jgi:hypothetical protein